MSHKSKCPQCGQPVKIPKGDPRPKYCPACVKADEEKYGLNMAGPVKRRRVRSGFGRVILGALAIVAFGGCCIGSAMWVSRLDQPGSVSSSRDDVPHPTYSHPSSQPSYTPPSSTASDDDRVQVRGYTRKDGTEVKAHTRSRPK